MKSCIVKYKKVHSPGPGVCRFSISTFRRATCSIAEPKHFPDPDPHLSVARPVRLPGAGAGAGASIPSKRLAAWRVGQLWQRCSAGLHTYQAAATRRGAVLHRNARYFANYSNRFSIQGGIFPSMQKRETMGTAKVQYLMASVTKEGQKK